jgi:hypothetical protein
MVKRAFPALVLLLTLMLSLSALGQDYRFRIPTYTCNVAVQKDRSLLIFYEITFACAPGAHPIDVVDIGFPTGDYVPGSVKAEIDGVPVEGIKASSYIPIGVEVPLGARAIAPGASGTLKVSGINPGMVFQDTSAPPGTPGEGQPAAATPPPAGEASPNAPAAASYASVEFTPTWFEGNLLEGDTHFKLQLKLPAGAAPDAVRYHDKPFTSSFAADDGSLVFVWEETRRVDGAYTVGASFPASLVEGPLPEKPSAAPASAGTTATGFETFLGCSFMTFFPAAFIGIIVLVVIASRKRKHQYLPPSIGVEGVGIKRGLTAPLAAMLLEEKLDRVIALVLYGLLRKNAVAIEEAAGKTVLRKGAADAGQLWDYEKAFLDSITDKGVADKTKLRDMVVAMVKDLKTRMKGFSVKETREYYRSIVRKAWDLVHQAGTDEAAQKTVEDQLSWIMLDRDFDRRVQQLPTHVFFPRPVWIPASYRAPATQGPAAAGPAVPAGAGWSLQQWCNQVASSIEGAAGGVAGSIESLASSVTAVTNPIPVSRSSGRSGGGCACACACAGCACACAGGGR